MNLRIHAIMLALNEEVFVQNQLRYLYPFCSGISVVSQHDRDWYGQSVLPDRTAQLVLDYPDPAGKISLVIRRFPDEAAARNQEMRALASQPHRGIQSHGSPVAVVAAFHDPPDYFWIIDADEIYDVQTLPRIIEYLGVKKPRGMRVNGLNYVRTWNRRAPAAVVPFCHFGFLRPGVFFESRRTVTWNESRVAKLLRLLNLPDISASLFGFEVCPWSVGYFHHGCWLGGKERLASKLAKSSHRDTNSPAYLAHVGQLTTEHVPTSGLPLNIRTGAWPTEFFE
jgi:hypothetical protein